jgi:hypothetical protein
LFYFKHESALRGGIRWTVEDTNIESAGALDLDPPITVTSVTSAGALDLDLIAAIESAGALILLTPVIDVIDTIK